MEVGSYPVEQKYVPCMYCNSPRGLDSNKQCEDCNEITRGLAVFVRHPEGFKFALKMLAENPLKKPSLGDERIKK